MEKSDLRQAKEDAYNEAARARVNWPPYNSAHEGYAILMEECQELWEEVCKKQRMRDLQRMRNEAIQVAAVALRFAAECCGEEVGRR